MLTLEKSAFTYTALFCEENIWKLIESLRKNKFIKPVDVLFLVNPFETIALHSQSRSNNTLPVIWDYHVILSANIENSLVIFDFDSRCHFPSAIETYFKSTFSDWDNISEKYQPLIKPVNAEYYLQNFSSDRSHMRDIIADSEFPKYEIIQASNTQTSISLHNCRDTGFIINNRKLLTPAQYLKKAGD